MNALSQDLVRELFDYEDGQLFYRRGLRNHITAGLKAGGVNNRGYEQVVINGSCYKAHRLIFLWHHGYLPEYVDHIDNDRLNNRIDNLRPCSIAQNNWNSGMRSDNASGYKGVSFHKKTGKWIVQMQRNGRKYHGGVFTDIDSANEAAIALRETLHKEFARNS